MAWFAVTRDFRTYQVVQATIAQGNSGTIGGASVAAGPFTTKAQAQAWVAGHAPAGSPPAPPAPAQGGGWYVITTRGLHPQTPFTVQVAQKPFPGPPDHQSLVDSGPYPTQAAAQAAAQKFSQHANNPFPGAGLASGTFGGLAAIGSFFQRISTPQMLLRIAEVLVGGILLIIGLARMAGVDQKLGGLVKIAAKVPA